MRAFPKTFFRMIKSNIARFIALMAIIAVGICFITGLGVITPCIKTTFDKFYSSTSVSDIIVRSKEATGFTQADIDYFTALNGVEQKESVKLFETKIDGKDARVYIQNASDSTVNKLELVSGEWASDGTQCVVEQASLTVEEVALGETLTIDLTDMLSDYIAALPFPIETKIPLEVSGTTYNPLFIMRQGEETLSETDSVPLSHIIYIEAAQFADSYAMLDRMLPTIDIYLHLSDSGKSYFSDKYFNHVEATVAAIEEQFGDRAAVLTLNENRAYATFSETLDKLDAVFMIFPVFFILVVALVVLTNMSRLVEEERTINGCYCSLGYSSAKIALRPMLFALLSSLLGIAVGLLIGAFLLPSIINPVFDLLTFLPPLATKIDITFGLWSSLGMLLSTLAVTLYVVMKTLRERPAELLKHKAPKPGKKIFLERIPFLWKHLKFRYKSALRNVFRYGGRLLMMVISVMGSTALVMAGIGLYDVCNGNFAGILAGMADTLSLLSIVIIIFAAVLCILVVYNLTNMSISERKREIATLEVLGYYDYEVFGYIYREILIMAFIGVLLGVPLGAGVLAFLFDYLAFGSMSGIHWYSYLIAAAVTFVFIGIVDIILMPKIKKIDMNESLKVAE